MPKFNLLVLFAFWILGVGFPCLMPGTAQGIPPSRSEGSDSNWTRIGIDYDMDNRWDDFVALHSEDLELARHRSRLRAEEAGARQQHSQHRAQEEATNTHRLRGSVTDRLVVRIGGMEQVFARIETSAGRRAKVWLGPRHRLDSLSIREGDHIMIEGVPVRVDERPVLLARRLSVNGRSITNDLPRGELRLVHGQLESKTTRRFRDREGRFAVARVRTDDALVRTVILGRQNVVSQVDLQPGDRITVLGKPARINGRPAVVAERIATRSQRLEVAQERSIGGRKSSRRVSDRAGRWAR